MTRTTRADELEIGQVTCLGLRIIDIKVTGRQYEVTFQRDSNRPIRAQYFPDQKFDIQEETNMAQKVNIIVESDLSGDADASTVTFGLDGHTYEIDLTDKEASKFREGLAKYVGAARPVKGQRKRRASGSATAGSNGTDGPSPRTIREWAKGQGMEVPERGRIPEEIREAYTAANA